MFGVKECFLDFRNKIQSRRLCIFTALVSTCCLEAALLWPSSALPMLTAPDSPVPIDKEGEDVIAWSLTGGSLVAYVVAGWSLNSWGRRPLLALAALAYLLGWILLGVATSLTALAVGRVVLGIASGLSKIVYPVYIAEIAKPEERGVAMAAILVFVVPPNVIMYVVGPLVSYHQLILLTAPIPVIFFLLVLLIIESPFYHVAHGDTQSAIETLEIIRKGKDVTQELKEIEELVAELGKLTWGQQLRGVCGKGLVQLVFLVIVYQCSGSLALLALLQPVLSGAVAPRPAPLSPSLAGLVVTLILFGAAPFALWLTRVKGTKLSLLLSTFGATISLVLLSVFLFMKDPYPDLPTWVPSAIFVAYFICISFGYNLLVPMFLAEVFEPGVKAAGFTISMIAGSAAEMLALHFLATWPLKFSITFFAVCGGLYTLCVLLLLPDTKDKTLLAVQRELHDQAQDNSTKL